MKTFLNVYMMAVRGSMWSNSELSQKKNMAVVRNLILWSESDHCKYGRSPNSKIWPYSCQPGRIRTSQL